MSGALSNDLPNGNHNIDGPDSPATPVDNSTTVDIKIDVDIPPADSDLRSEPVQMNVDELDQVRDASTVPQLDTPQDPASIPIAPPKGTPPPENGTLLPEVKTAEAPATDDDVKMEDVQSPNPTLNGVAHSSQEEPSPTATAGSAAMPAVSSSATVVDALAASPYSNYMSNNDDDKPPPAKRARKWSDAEKASVANTATPPPASPSPVPAPPNGTASTSATIHTGPPTLSIAQWRFCTSTVRTLRKLKDAGPFLNPVDHVALNIPHYPTIIKQPMDFSTIDRKLSSSNPTKPDSNSANPRYNHADEFVADVRLIFTNCVTFNGPDHPITAMGKRVEAVFDKQIKQMPVPDEVKPIPVKKPSPPPPPPKVPRKRSVMKATPPEVAPKPVAKHASRPSVSSATPVIRRSESEAVGRPKREIHPPPPKDLPYADAPKKARKTKAPRNDVNAEQLKFCDKILKELHKKGHYTYAHPFYEPVDWVKLDIPLYPKVIKKPMDLLTMRKKLTNSDYSSADEFHADFKLMMKNCYTFNPVNTAVHEAGRSLEAVFDQKWQGLPPLHHDASDESEESEEEDDEQARIAELESQIEHMNRTLEGLKKDKSKTKKKEKKPKQEKPPVPSTSKPAPKPAKAAPPKPSTKKNNKRPIADDDVLSFEQKKDLSDTIAKLDGTKLERVIQIIHEGVPEIRDSTEEIELEIDQLPASVLTKLYNFVIRPMRPPPPKRPRTGKGTGTGGLKRKSMDEDVEAEKIRVLEARMALFEGKGRAAAVEEAHGGDDSSDSSSSDDDSASDSE